MTAVAIIAGMLVLIFGFDPLLRWVEEREIERIKKKKEDKK